MKFCVFTLGCKVNKYESDSILRALVSMGHEVTDKLEPADIYILNTCAVTSEAEKKSRQLVARCRKFNKKAKIYVLGCASQTSPEEFVKKGVEFVSGTAGKNKILKNIENLSGVDISELPKIYEDNMQAKEMRTRAYIKIQDGCDYFCSYCLIPYLRGRSRSREIFSVLNEIHQLPQDVKEIVLVGINLTDYKIDGQPALITLLEEVDKLGKRIRLGSIEESIITEEFANRLKLLKNFCPHFHLSMQSGSDSVLKRMNRHYTSAEFLETVNIIYAAFPSASITTDVIVGFPEETHAEFEETYSVCERAGFLHMHIFPYSKREGTVAARMKPVADSIKSQRAMRLEELNSKLKHEFISKQKFGRVLVEEFKDGMYEGHTENFVSCRIKSRKNILNQTVNVKFKKPFKDGAYVKVCKKLGEF